MHVLEPVFGDSRAIRITGLEHANAAAGHTVMVDDPIRYMEALRANWIPARSVMLVAFAECRWVAAIGGHGAPPR